MAARRQRPLQLASVPAASGAEDRDAQPASAHRRPAGATIWAGLRTLLIDNYDSYTFNLFHLLGEVNDSEPVVVRNDELPWEELAALGADNVVVSPGPGRPEHTRDVGVSLDALYRAEVRGISMSRVQGHGGELERVETYRGTTVQIGMSDKVRFEIAVSDDFVQPAIDALCDGGRTGEVGDGKIFVVPLERAVRIRTGETDQGAVTPVTS